MLGLALLVASIGDQERYSPLVPLARFLLLQVRILSSSRVPCAFHFSRIRSFPHQPIVVVFRHAAFLHASSYHLPLDQLQDNQDPSVATASGPGTKVAYRLLQTRISSFVCLMCFRWPRFHGSPPP